MAFAIGSCMLWQRSTNQKKGGIAFVFMALCLCGGYGFSTESQSAEKMNSTKARHSLGVARKATHEKPEEGDSVPEFVTAEDISSVIRVLSSIGKGTLVLFDCDDVLVTANIGVFARNPSSTGSGRNEFGRIIHRELPDADSAKFLSMSQTVVGASPTRLLNSRMPGIVDDLQAKGIKCLVITAFPPTPAPGMLHPLEWRSGTLQNFGYKFSRSWPGMPCTQLEGGPVFDRGIIYSGAIPKAQSLAAFLPHVKMTPSRIVFIDDFLENLLRMKEYCKRNRIPFTGIHYTEFSRAVNPITPSIARSEFQMMVLIKHEVWLPDEILPGENFCLDWVELCKRSIALKNVNCIAAILGKVEKRHGSHLVALARKTGSKDVIQCVTQWAKS
jgi:hypothetical protein